MSGSVNGNQEGWLKWTIRYVLIPVLIAIIVGAFILKAINQEIASQFDAIIQENAVQFQEFQQSTERIIDDSFATSRPPVATAIITQIIVTATPSPNPTATNGSPNRPGQYVVVPGDTLFGIAQRFNTTVNEIITVNGLPSYALSVGQLLTIPRTENALEETAVTSSPTSVTNTSPTPTPDPNSEATTVPPESLAPTGRVEVTYPQTMMVEEGSIITVEIIADPVLAVIEKYEPHITGVIRIDAINYSDGSREHIEETINLFPLMSAELDAPAFEVSPKGNDNVRLPRVISTTLPAAWTWGIIANAPGEKQEITVNIYEEPGNENGLPVLRKSIPFAIHVSAKGRWSQIVDGLADNVLVLLGTGGPLGLALAYLTYRANKENERLKKEVSSLNTRKPEAPPIREQDV
jgi:LysM repeat protein